MFICGENRPGGRDTRGRGGVKWGEVGLGGEGGGVRGEGGGGGGG